MRIQDDWRTIKVLWSRELFRMVKEPSRMLGVVVQPLLFWFVIGSGFVPSFRIEQAADLTYQTFFFPGVLAMVILFSAIFSTITLIDDRASGFLQVILVGPGSRAALVIGKILGVMTIASIQALLFLCVAPFAGIGLHHIDFILLIAFIVLGSAATAGVGFVFAWGTQSSAAYHALMSVILIPLWILSGAMFPPSVRWIEAIVQVNPLGWMVAGFRAAFSNGVAPFGTVNPNLTAQMSLIYLLIFCIVIIGIGVYLCQRRK